MFFLEMERFNSAFWSAVQLMHAWHRGIKRVKVLLEVLSVMVLLKD